MNFSSSQVIRALGGSTLRMTELLDGTTVYMKPPPALSGMLGASGKPWLRLDAAKALRVPALASMSAGPGMSDPGQPLQYPRAVSGNVVSEGQQWVDGFDTIHYPRGAQPRPRRERVAPGGPGGSATSDLSP